MAQSGARERLAASGIVVYLRSRPETLLARLGQSTGRPLLGEGGAGERLERLRDLLGDREPAYQTASLIVDTDDARPEEVAETVARRIREQWEAGPR
jgi:shikimate kinase